MLNGRAFGHWEPYYPWRAIKYLGELQGAQGRARRMARGGPAGCPLRMARGKSHLDGQEDPEGLGNFQPGNPQKSQKNGGASNPAKSQKDGQEDGPWDFQ